MHLLNQRITKVFLSNLDRQQLQHIRFAPSWQHHPHHSKYHHYLKLEHQLVLNVQPNLQSWSNLICLHKVVKLFVHAKPPKQHLDLLRSLPLRDRCDVHDRYPPASLPLLAFHTYLLLSPMLRQLLKIIFAYMEELRRRRVLLPLELDNQNLNRCGQLNFQLLINQSPYQQHWDQLRKVGPI